MAITQEEREQAHTAVALHGSVSAAARALDMPRGTLRHRLKGWTLADPPRDGLPIGDLIDRRIEEFKQKENYEKATKLTHMDLNMKGPFGIMFFGDLHMDDAGCDMATLVGHTSLCKESEAVFGVAVGDLQNAWPRQLAHLWGEQTTTAREAVMLVQWWMEELAEKLLLIVSGNHDYWSRNVNGIGPIEWITSLTGTPTAHDGARIALHLPGGRTITINCRHDFTGQLVIGAENRASRTVTGSCTAAHTASLTHEQQRLRYQRSRATILPHGREVQAKAL